MPTLVLGQGRAMRYEDYGSGPVVVLIHGSPGSSKSWQRVGERLSARFRIVAPNLPGYGGSDPRPKDVATDTAWVAGLIESLLETIGAPAILAGHSYGGNVALAVAIRRRAAVKGLALFEPVALPVLRVAGEDQLYMVAKAAVDDYVASHEGGDGRAVRKMVDFWFGPGTFDGMPERVQDYLVRETALNVLDVKATHREQYSLSDLQGLRMPVLLVYGSKSPKLTFQIVDAIARHTPGSSVVSLEGANHAMTTTHDDTIAQLLADHAAMWAQLDGPADAPTTARR